MNFQLFQCKVHETQTLKDFNHPLSVPECIGFLLILLTNSLERN